MTLTPDDLRQILKVLDDSPYDELEFETDRFTLNLKRSANGRGWLQQTSTRAETTEVLSVAESARPGSSTEPEPSEAGLSDIRAPMVGTFYRSPKPGADPFTDAGKQVEENSIIGIIEVMKLMNSIPAGVSGTVVELHAEDATLVEKGQLLMRVRP